MFGVKTDLISVVVLLFVLQPGTEPQPTVVSTTEDDSCSQLQEDLEFRRIAIENERQKTKTGQEVSSSPEEEIQWLKLELECERGRPVTATLIRKLETGEHNYLFGIPKVGDRIYVLGRHPKAIKVFEDRNEFSLVREIPLTETSYTNDIVYSNESKCFYISDESQNCIWVMTSTDEHRLTKWLSNVTSSNTLSFSKEGHLLMLREEQSQLEFYSLNATLVRRLQLPQYIKTPNNVVQTSAGNFIISHRLNSASDGQWVISQLTNDGNLINRFVPRIGLERLIEPRHFCLDSDNNRLFVVDYFSYRVLLFDVNSLTWSQELLTRDRNELDSPWRAFYDASKKHLLVAGHGTKALVFEIN